jgi:GT2 family glycosyltransferase
VPRVDVVVVTYRSADTIVGAVQPLTGLDTVRVIVVDNASDDGTVDALAGLRVEVLAQADNRGFAHGCNVGIAAGDAPYVLLLNPDARLDGAALRTLVDELERDADAGIVAPRILEPDGSLDFSLRRFPRLRSSLAQAFFLHRVFPAAKWTDEVIRDPSAYDAAHGVEWASGACLLVRRPLLERLGGLDEGFFLYSEDVDLCARVWKEGFEVRYVPAAVAQHEGGASAPRAQLLPILAASRIRYSRKHDSGQVTLLLRGTLALGSATHAVVGRGAGARRGHLRALRVALTPLPADPRRLLEHG